MQALKELYEAIIGSSQTVFGSGEAQKEILDRLNGIDHSVVAGELFSYKALITDNELRHLYVLNEFNEGGVDFTTATNADIKTLLKKIEFEQPPESNLVVKSTIIKREAGLLNSFKDATAVLTRDNYFYIFEWQLQEQEG